MEDLPFLLGLAASAFVSATVLPGTSEAVLIGYSVQGISTPFVLWLVATLSNLAGSLINWVLGLYVTRFRDRKWFPANEKQIERAERWYRKYGVYTLLMTWMPLIGDPLTVVAGIFRTPIIPFVVMVTIAKGARYAALLIFLDTAKGFF